MGEAFRRKGYKVADSPTYSNPMLGATKKPTCPKCNAQMVKRITKRGDNAGQSFWGCSSFPKCHGIKPI